MIGGPKTSFVSIKVKAQQSFYSTTNLLAGQREFSPEKNNENIYKKIEYPKAHWNPVFLLLLSPPIKFKMQQRKKNQQKATPKKKFSKFYQSNKTFCGSPQSRNLKGM